MSQMSLWTNATANLSWGRQRVLLDTLEMVKAGQIKVVYGADSFKGSPCLLNAVGCMIKGENQAPSEIEARVVSAFDNACQVLFAPAGMIDEKPYLSPLAAETLIRHFGDLKEQPTVTEVYTEKSDEQIQAEIEAAWAAKPQAEKDAIMARHPVKGKKAE